MGATTRVKVLVVAAVAAAGMTTVAASADHCGEDTQYENAHDPFGSCEEEDGRVRCGTTGTASEELPAGGRLTIGEQGVQFCLDEDNSDAQPYGRLSVYSSEGHVGFAADGDDRNDPGPIPGVPLHGWGRADVNTETMRACVATDVAGTYWQEGGPKGGLVCAP